MTAHSINTRVTPTRPRRWKAVGVNPYLYAALVLILFLGFVQMAQAAGMWSTSGKVTGTGEKIAATGTDPAEIKGWMTIGEILSAYNVPKDEFYAQFKLPADMPVSTAVKDIEKQVEGFSTDAVRTWLAARNP